MSEPIQKTSCGGVVVRTDGAFEVCLIRPIGRSVWGLPKGGVEEGETFSEAASREVAEETGMTGIIEAELGSIDYTFYSRTDNRRIHKTVHYFLMRAGGGDTEWHDHEVSEARWVRIDEALRLMTYPNEREMVRRAAEMLGDATHG